jgi:hypothetical protein
LRKGTGVPWSNSNLIAMPPAVRISDFEGYVQ